MFPDGVWKDRVRASAVAAVAAQSNGDAEEGRAAAPGQASEYSPNSSRNTPLTSPSVQWSFSAARSGWRRLAFSPEAARSSSSRAAHLLGDRDRP